MTTAEDLELQLSTLTKDQLRDECLSRNLPVSGAVPVLIARIVHHDAPELAFDETPPPPREPGLPLPADEIVQPAPAPVAPVLTTEPVMQTVAPEPVPVQPAQPAANPEPRVVERVHVETGRPASSPRDRVAHTQTYRFACPGELSTGVHQDNQRRAYEQAIADGLRPRGGTTGAHRTGFETVDGIRYAVYELHIRV